MNLFDYDENTNFRPLADIVRPKNLEDFVGQEDIVGKNSLLRKTIENDNISSIIFYGPPGTGKTTLAKIIANKTSSSFHQLSAVESGVKDIKQIEEIAKMNKLSNKKTILFIDEIHRFNKSQQDTLLPYVEKGDIILIGATTENPSFEVNSALLSRSKVYVLHELSNDNLRTILDRTLKDYYPNIKIDKDAKNIIVESSKGDARSLLNTLENIIKCLPKNKEKITKQLLEKIIGEATFLYDKNGEEHYNLISALHKSLRNSDVDASLYYLARMFEAGEDPLYIARRLIRFASEDIGLANSNALLQAVAAFDACKYIGPPECNVNLSQAVVYLATSPKSNSLYIGYEKAKEVAKKTSHIKVPNRLRNAVTKLDQNMGYGKDYEYSQDYKYKMTDMKCLPDSLLNQKFYFPSESGNEKNVKARLEQINRIKTQINKNKSINKNI